MPRIRNTFIEKDSFELVHFVSLNWIQLFHNNNILDLYVQTCVSAQGYCFYLSVLCKPQNNTIVPTNA
jgi:hypothetical protein